MKKGNRSILSIIVVGVAICVFSIAAVYSASGPPSGWTGSGIAYKVCPEAKITNVSYYIKPYKKKPSLYFKVSVKNISDKAARFKVTVFVGENASIAGLYPRRGKKAKGGKPAVPAVVQPGKEHSRDLPVVIVTSLPKGFAVVVEKF